MEMLPYGAMVVIVLIVIAFENKRCKRIGNIGETIVKHKLDMLGSDFVVLNNVRYKKTQIDHMVICNSLRLIFVIETKKWGGIITGESCDKYWKQSINGQVKYLNNPILQNKYHCSVVRRKYKGYSVRSIIVFVGNKNIPRLGCITNEDGVVNYIIQKSNIVRNPLINLD